MNPGGFQFRTMPAGETVLAIHSDRGELVFSITADGKFHLTEGWTPDAVGTLFADLIAEQVKAQAQPPGFDPNA